MLAGGQRQSGICPVFADGNSLTVYGDGHIFTKGHALHSGKHLTQGQSLAIGGGHIFNRDELVLGKDVFHLPVGHVPGILIVKILDGLHLGGGVGIAVIAQGFVHSLNSLAQGGVVVGTGDGQFLAIYRKGNDGIALNGSGGTQLAQSLVLAENVLQAQGQHILLDAAVFHISLGLQVVNTQAVAVAGDQSIDHSVSLEGSLIAQGNRAGNQANIGNTGIEAVSRVNAILADHQVILGVTLNQLFHSTIDSTGQAAALVCLILIVGGVHQLQGNSLVNGDVGGLESVQIQAQVMINHNPVNVLGQLVIAFSGSERSLFRCGYSHDHQTCHQSQHQNTGDDAHSHFCTILHLISSNSLPDESGARRPYCGKRSLQCPYRLRLPRQSILSSMPNRPTPLFRGAGWRKSYDIRKYRCW